MLLAASVAVGSSHSNSVDYQHLSPLENDMNLLWRHIGHCPFAESCLIHSTMQCCPLLA